MNLLINTVTNFSGNKIETQDFFKRFRITSLWHFSRFHFMIDDGYDITMSNQNFSQR